MIFSLGELFDAVMMTLIVGFIFADFFQRFIKPKNYDPIQHYQKKSFFSSFGSEGFKMAVLVVAPAIVFHELAHKFMALGFGMDATFHAAYIWLAIGVILKLMNFGFIFFVPAYVQIGAAGSPLMMSAVAFAGPLMNAVLWLGCWVVVKKRWVKNKYLPFFAISAKINMFLFFFNMIPLPLFDGYKVFSGLWQFFVG